MRGRKRENCGDGDEKERERIVVMEMRNRGRELWWPLPQHPSFTSWGETSVLAHVASQGLSILGY
jgi:hypothetical protein